MQIDCDTCPAPGYACAGCVMTVLLARGRATGGGRGLAVRLDAAEREALGHLAGAGLVSPLPPFEAASVPADSVVRVPLRALHGRSADGSSSECRGIA